MNLFNRDAGINKHKLNWNFNIIWLSLKLIYSEIHKKYTNFRVELLYILSLWLYVVRLLAVIISSLIFKNFLQHLFMIRICRHCREACLMSHVSERCPIFCEMFIWKKTIQCCQMIARFRFMRAIGTVYTHFDNLQI